MPRLCRPPVLGFAALAIVLACGETTTDERARVDGAASDAAVVDGAPEASLCKPLASKEACCAASEPQCFWLPASYGVADVCLAIDDPSLAASDSCGPAPAPFSTPCAAGERCLLRRYDFGERGDCLPPGSWSGHDYPIGVCIAECPEGTIEYTMTNGNPGCKIEP